MAVNKKKDATTAPSTVAANGRSKRKCYYVDQRVMWLRKATDWWWDLLGRWNFYPM